MKRALRFLIPIAFILAVIIPGCYTVVVHPSEEGGYHAQQTSDCTRCHSDYREYPYGYYYTPSPDYWWNHSDYAYYYAYPWWWSYYDYPYMTGDYEYSNSSSGRDTKFDRRESPREPAAPPYSSRSREDWTPEIIQPGVEGTNPSVGNQGSGTTGTARTQPGEVTDDNPPQDATSTKIERATRQEPKATDDQNVGQDGSNRDRQPADSTKESKDKKKSRRGGDGK